VNWSRLRNKRTLVRLSAAAILLLVAVLVVPALINLDGYAHLLADALTEALGSRVAIERGRPAILPDVSFVVSGVELPDGVGPIEKLSVPRARIDLDVLSLLFGKILVEEIHVHSPQVWLVRDGKPEDESAPRLSAMSSEASPLSFLRDSDMLPERLDVSISGGRITIVDRVVASPATVETWFCDTDIEVCGMSCDTPFNVSASCDLSSGGDIGEIAAEFQIDPSMTNCSDGFLPFKFSGSITAEGIVCSAFSAYLPDDVQKAGLSGRCRLDVNLETQGVRQLSLNGEMAVSGLSLKRNLSGRDLSGVHDLDISFSAALSSHAVHVQSVHIGIDDNKIGGQLTVIKPEAGEAVMQCAFGAYKLPISTVLDLLPAPLLPPDTRDRIQSMNISGEIRQLMTGFAGRASDLCDSTSLVPKPLVGFCSVNRMKASEVLGTLGVEEFSGRASLGEGVISFDIEDGFITSPSNECPLKTPRYVDIDIGTLSDLKAKATGRSWMDLVEGCNPSRGSDPLVFVRTHLASMPVADVHRILGAMALPVNGERLIAELDGWSGEIKGHCDVAVFLTGPSEPSVDAKIYIPGCRLRYKPLDIRVRPISIEANISPQSARLDTLFAFKGRSPLTCTIEIDRPYSDSASLSAKATYKYRQDLFDPSSREVSPEAFAIDGPDAVVEATATGSYHELAIAIESDLTAQEMAYGEWFRKQAGEHCKLSLSAKTSGLEEVSIDEAQIEVGGVVVRGSGKITSPDAPQWEMSVYLNSTDVSELARFCPRAQEDGGEARLHGWFKAFPQGAASAESVPDGSPPPSSNSCEAGLVLALDAQAIDNLLSAEFMPDGIRDVARRLDLASGRARVEATARFSLDSVWDAKFKVAAELRDIRGAHTGVSLGFSGVSGDLELTGDALRIERLSGVFGQSDFELKGEIKEPLLVAFKGDEWPRVQGDMRLVIEPMLPDLRAILGADFIEDMTYSQAPEVELGANGTLDDLAIDARFTPRGATLTWGDVRLNPERADLSILLTGRLQKLARLSAVKGEVMVGASRLKFTGEAVDLTNPELNFHTTGSPVRIADISALLPIFDPSLARGELVLSLDGKFGPQAPTYRRFEARLRARDVSFGLTGAERHFENLNFSLNASPSAINVDSFSVRIGQSEASLDARADFDADVLRLSLKSHNVNTDDLAKVFPSKAPGQPESATTASTATATPASDLTWLEELPFFARGRVDVSVSVGKFKMGDHDFGQILLALPVRDGVLRIDGFETDFCQGNLSLNLVSRLLLECGLSLETDFKLKDVRLEEVLELLGAEKVIATGTARISGGFQVCGSDTDELLNFAQGQLKLKSRDGVIKKFGLLSKIFSLLDILRVFKMDFRDFATTGTSYELLKCTAKLKDGVLSTRDFVLVGSSMKMTAICDVDLLSRTIEATVGVFLLPAMGSIAHVIPFVGPMITQENKTLLPTYFRVHGDLSDPKVESLHLDRIKNTTIEALRKLLGGGASTGPSSSGR